MLFRSKGITESHWKWTEQAEKEGLLEKLFSQEWNKETGEWVKAEKGQGKNKKEVESILEALAFAGHQISSQSQDKTKSKSWSPVSNYGLVNENVRVHNIYEQVALHVKGNEGSREAWTRTNSSNVYNEMEGPQVTDLDIKKMFRNATILAMTGTLYEQDVDFLTASYGAKVYGYEKVVKEGFNVAKKDLMGQELGQEQAFKAADADKMVEKLLKERKGNLVLFEATSDDARRLKNGGDRIREKAIVQVAEQSTEHNPLDLYVIHATGEILKVNLEKAKENPGNWLDHTEIVKPEVNKKGEIVKTAQEVLRDRLIKQENVVVLAGKNSTFGKTFEGVDRTKGVKGSTERQDKVVIIADEKTPEYFIAQATGRNRWVLTEKGGKLERDLNHTVTRELYVLKDPSTIKDKSGIDTYEKGEFADFVAKTKGDNQKEFSQQIFYQQANELLGNIHKSYLRELQVKITSKEGRALAKEALDKIYKKESLGFLDLSHGNAGKTIEQFQKTLDSVQKEMRDVFTPRSYAEAEAKTFLKVRTGKNIAGARELVKALKEYKKNISEMKIEEGMSKEAREKAEKEIKAKAQEISEVDRFLSKLTGPKKTLFDYLNKGSESDPFSQAYVREHILKPESLDLFLSFRKDSKAVTQAKEFLKTASQNESFKDLDLKNAQKPRELLKALKEISKRDPGLKQEADQIVENLESERSQGFISVRTPEEFARVFRETMEKEFLPEYVSDKS